jgi:hypothetical protein
MPHDLKAAMTASRPGSLNGRKRDDIRAAVIVGSRARLITPPTPGLTDRTPRPTRRATTRTPPGSARSRPSDHVPRRARYLHALEGGSMLGSPLPVRPSHRRAHGARPESRRARHALIGKAIREQPDSAPNTRPGYRVLRQGRRATRSRFRYWRWPGKLPSGGVHEATCEFWFNAV